MDTLDSKWSYFGGLVFDDACKQANTFAFSCLLAFTCVIVRLDSSFQLLFPASSLVWNLNKNDWNFVMTSVIQALCDSKFGGIIF